MVDPELRLVPVVSFGTGPKHDTGVVNQDVDVHVFREDGASKLLHGTEALRVKIKNIQNVELSVVLYFATQNQKSSEPLG